MDVWATKPFFTTSWASLLLVMEYMREIANGARWSNSVIELAKSGCITGVTLWEMRNDLVGGDEDKRQNAPIAGNHTKEPIFSTEGTHRLQIINSMMAVLCWKNVNYKNEKRPWLIIILLAGVARKSCPVQLVVIGGRSRIGPMKF